MKRLFILAALALSPAAFAAKASPWACLPYIDAPEASVYHYVDPNGEALIWSCQVNGVKMGQELHATRDWLDSLTDIVAIVKASTTDPIGTFWNNAKTSRCLDPNGYWPTAQDRALCAGVRKVWADKGLK